MPVDNPSESRWVAGLILLVATLTVMAGATIAPSLPAMRQAFREAPNAAALVPLVLTAPALAIALTAPLVGWAVDRVGRKPVLLGSVLLYGAAGGSGLVLDDLPAILAGRVVLGLAVAGCMTSSTALIGDFYDPVVRQRFLGLRATFMAYGGVAFVTVGGLLAEVSWRGPFAVYLLAWALAPFIAWAIPEPQEPAGLFPSGGPGHAPDGDEAGSLRQTMLFVYATATVGMVAFYMGPVHLPFHLEDALGARPAATGFAIAAATLASGTTSLFYRRIKARLSFLNVQLASWVAVGLGFLVIAVARGWAGVVLGTALTGVGLGLLMPNIGFWMVTVAPPGLRGRLLGGMTASVFLGQFICPLATQPLVSRVGYPGAFATAGGSLVVAAGLLYVLRPVPEPAAVGAT